MGAEAASTTVSKGYRIRVTRFHGQIVGMEDDPLRVLNDAEAFCIKLLVILAQFLVKKNFLSFSYIKATKSFPSWRFEFYIFL